MLALPDPMAVDKYLAKCLVGKRRCRIRSLAELRATENYFVRKDATRNICQVRGNLVRGIPLGMQSYINAGPVKGSRYSTRKVEKKGLGRH